MRSIFSDATTIFERIVHTQTGQPGRVGSSVGTMGMGWEETAGYDCGPCELLSREILSDETCSFFGADCNCRLNVQSEGIWASPSIVPSTLTMSPPLEGCIDNTA